jgi:hypothetical protein
LENGLVCQHFCLLVLAMGTQKPMDGVPQSKPLHAATHPSQSDALVQNRPVAYQLTQKKILLLLEDVRPNL